jgi:hypothetical protein
MPRRTRPPRAVSRTATSRSERPRICHAPPGPVQSPGSTRRSSTSTPSDVVVPTRCPATLRMCVISRVTVLLPFVPVIETTGIRRSASRIQAGGVVRASPIRALQRASWRSCDPVSRARRAGETSRSARAIAASAIVWARSAPVHGNVTIQWPGSDERWTATPPVPSPWSERSRRTQRTRASTEKGHCFAGTSAPRWTSAWRPGLRCPYHVRRRPTATSIFTTGSSR